MKRLFLRLLKKLRQLFDFHQPRFLHLDCIDLVLENRSLLLLSWDTAHAVKIRLRPGKTTFWQSTGAAICSLPTGTDSVDIILYSVWRSTKTSFRLKRIAIDHQTLQYLDEHFPAGLAVSINHVQPAFPASIIVFKRLLPQLSLNMEAPVFNISINQPKLDDYAP